MTSKDINTGGPAFPCPPNETAKKQCEAAGVNYYAPTGMTLRDYLAAKAMQGELASQNGGDYEWRDHEKLARHCYNIADAMLEARDE